MSASDASINLLARKRTKEISRRLSQKVADPRNQCSQKKKKENIDEKKNHQKRKTPFQLKNIEKMKKKPITKQ